MCPEAYARRVIAGEENAALAQARTLRVCEIKRSDRGCVLCPEPPGVKKGDPLRVLSGSGYVWDGLGQRRCVLCKVLVAVRVGDGSIRVAIRESPRARLAVDHVIGGRDHIKVAHLVDQCARLGIGA